MASLPFEKQAFKPAVAESLFRHDNIKVNAALSILNGFLKDDVVVVIYNGSDKKEVKSSLKDALKDDFLDAVSGHQFKQDENVSLVRNATINKQVIERYSCQESMIFLLYLDRTEILSFGDTVAIMEPLDNEEMVGLSRMFSIPYDDWYLALVLLELKVEIRNAYLDILESPLVSSITMSPFLIKNRQFSKVMKLSERARVLRSLYEKNVLEFVKEYPFSLIYHFMHKQ